MFESLCSSIDRPRSRGQAAGRRVRVQIVLFKQPLSIAYEKD